MTDSRMALLGINLSGAEFGSIGQAYGTGYTYPTNAEVDYYASKGLNVIRLPFLWERLQPTLNGALNPAELARMQDFVGYATSKGLTVILDPHDYGNYYGNAIGSSAVPNSAFANLWGKIAANFKNNPDVMFGLMNEPGQSSAAGWLQSVNAAISAIRQAGATQEIFVPGINYDGAWTWTSSQNAGVIGTGVQDPANNFAFEVHQYLDSDGSGSHSNVVSTTVGADRLQAVTQWAETNGAKLFLGEVGVASDQTSLTALGNMLGYMDQHTSVWQGATYWAGGPWWGNYMYSAEPQNGIDSAQMTVLEQFAPTASSSPSISIDGIARDNILNAAEAQGSLVITGTTSGVSGGHVTVTLDQVSYAATVSPGGAWSVSVAPSVLVPSLLPDGLYTVQADLTDANGRLAQSATANLIADQTAPGISMSGGGLTGHAGQTITGTVDMADAGRTVSVYDNAGANALGTAMVQSNGAWSAAVTLPVQGSNVLLAKVTDAAGNTGTSAAVIYTLDSVAPPVVITTSTPNLNSGDPLGVAPNVVSPPTAVSPSESDPGAPMSPSSPDGAMLDLALAGTVSPFTPPPLPVPPAPDDTTPPNVTFDSTVTFTSPTNATLTGTVSDNVGVASVTLFANGDALGTAAVAADGTWSFTQDVASGVYTGIAAVATDTSGNSASAPSDFDLTMGTNSGIPGQPYAAVQDRYAVDGTFLGQTFFKANGAGLFASDYTALPNGGSIYTYASGNFFNNKRYSSFTDLYSANSSLSVHTENNKDGSHTISGVHNGQVLASIANDTFTGDAKNERFVFTAGYGHDTIKDFQVAGAGHDTIVLPSANMASLAQIIANAHSVGGDTTLHTGPHDTLTLQGVSKADLKAHLIDFRFHT